MHYRPKAQQPKPPPGLPFPTGRKPFPVTERWIYFSIETPLITLTPVNGLSPRVPPNLPADSPPISWVLFAAPLPNVKVHPGWKDSKVVLFDDGTRDLVDVKLYKYDFARNGTPAFEFLDKSEILGEALGTHLQATIGGDFLNAHRLPVYNANSDRYVDTPVSPSPRAATFQEEIERQACFDHEEMKRWSNMDVMERNESVWWQAAKEGFRDSAFAWRRIREAMSRNCCSVLVGVDDVGEQMGRNLVVTRSMARRGLNTEVLQSMLGNGM